MSYISDMRKYIGHAPMLSAGAAIVVIEDGKILLNLRSDTKNWGVPAGAMELRESLEQTAERELKEETNLSVESLEFLHMFSGEDYYFKYPNGDELYTVIALYRAIGATGELQINDGESLELRFFGREELPSQLEARSEKMLNWLIENNVI